MQDPLLRVAVIGGGISGLALAGVLSKAKIEIFVDVYERATADRDEGYGLDFDEHGQKALKLAGVFHRYWEFSRPMSDVMRFYLLDQESPLLTMFTSKFLFKLQPGKQPQPESNRAGYRQVMLESFQESGKVKVMFKARVGQLVEYVDPSNGKQKMDVIAENNQLLGRYDLVVDCSGVHSKFRHLRVDDPVGKRYSGFMMVHGATYNPEACWPQSMLKKLGEGTLAVFAGGYRVAIQRYAAKPEDKRTAFMYFVRRPNEDTLFDEIGIQKANSREEGIVKDAENLNKIKNWLHKDMEFFSADFHRTIDCIDRLTVRPDFCHGDTRLKPNFSLPFVCIGDSMCCIGIGGGGNVCLNDVTEFCETLVDNVDVTSGRIDFEKIRIVEEKIIKRRNQFIKYKTYGYSKLVRPPGPDPRKMNLFWTFTCLLLTFFSNLLVFLEELFFGKLGSPQPKS